MIQCHGAGVKSDDGVHVKHEMRRSGSGKLGREEK